MEIALTPAGARERVSITRPDGSTSEFSIPRKGVVSHDLVHFCVESALGLKRGFWGSVAAGEDPEAIQERAKVGGHASASRATTPASDLVELLQAERLVEGFEAESWCGTVDDAGLLAMARAGWEASYVPALMLEPEDLAAVRAMLDELGGQWKALEPGASLHLEWKE